MAVSDHPRMSDVAERAGVSLSTVSRALRGATGVAPSVRENVERAAAELGYVVSRGASGLVTGRTGRIAVLVPFLQPWFFGVALAGMSTEMRSSGRDMLVYQVGDVTELNAYIRSLPLRSNVDAVIAVALDLEEGEAARFDEIGVPVVFCSQRVKDRASVFIDNTEAAADAARHLLNLGHARIAYIQSSDETGFSWASHDRLRGYEAAMAEAGAAPLVVTERPGHEGGALGMGRLLSMADPPTAVFAESDDVAMGALQVVRRSRLEVPDVVSVMGFDDSDMAALADLTTVAQPVFDMGVQAARLAAETIDASEPCSEHVRLDTRLVVRRSTAVPRPTRSLTGR
ncbi:DNA-binding LacI/PurR family transcriptional regulator [Spinactinospora alkalitolerans]|uniref:DNA-binding LacI/PurR family transcriptional regulator n=1 Tax=Spinactinospora alkalitolerans TaxID=687207 RepID=A0A852U3R2_9ACTN|nr:LacI family DNA-binding transcriptional regulator [Spinactinospora alkalitolerans]NYE50829.1 DNA-binding LacI/PurR family transcriptional regulator [Spinactinospora alkalitolerans]